MLHSIYVKMLCDGVFKIVELHLYLQFFLFAIDTVILLFDSR